jgi:hypothetical protein
MFNGEDSPIFVKGLPTTPQVKLSTFKRQDEDDIE